MYEQVRTPNYTAKGKAGWCLSVQQDNWGVEHLYTVAPNNTAKYAWDVSKYKHPGERPPTNIHALCYWTYRENGIDYWHVATRHPNGQVFSSPFDTSYGNQWFSSIDAQTERIRKIYPQSQYVGWVEDLSNVRLVQKEDDMLTKEDVKLLFWLIFDQDPTEDQYAFFTGKSIDFVLKNLFESDKFKTHRDDVRKAFDTVNKSDATAQDTNQKVNWLVTMFQKIFK